MIMPYCNLHTNFISKIFIFVISLATIIFLTLFLAPHSITYTINHEHVCDRADESNSINLVKAFLVKSLPEMKMAVESAGYMIRRTYDYKEKAALDDCLELMDLSIDKVKDTLTELTNWSSVSDSDNNVHTWLSGILTNHITCFEGIEHTSQDSIKNLMQDLISKTRKSLAVLACLSNSDKRFLQPLNGRFPQWALANIKDRKILESWSENKVKADVVVAQDGSGDYRTVREAVGSAPDRSKSRYVIHVKKGIYKENVEVGKKKKNLMIVGDGMNKTIITGSRNAADGSTTFKSATLAVAGDGFILQDISIQNTAGPEKHQAVALRVSADQSVVNRCQIDAYQDSLYAHSYRQFYRDCSILGTVDFIFGDAAVVFQKCKIIAKKPLPNQKNMITAQGRSDPNQNTGTSIQDCKIIPSPDYDPLVGNLYSTFLGRPWREYSRTVVMESYIDKHVDPAGWAKWNGDFAVRSLYYGEYANRGPGSDTSERVKWEGFHVITVPNEAMKFTVGELIQGDVWLSSTGVSFNQGL